MRNAFAIASKELRSYFASPIGWVMMGLFAVVFGWFFSTYLNYFLKESMQAQFGQQQATNVNMRMIRPLLGNASVLILFLLPMITMRSYAEEKRSGTIELLLTSPLTDWQIIVGKFLGAMGMYLAWILTTAVYVGILFNYGNPEIKPLLSGYFGLLLQGGAFISVGLFISSTTKNQMVAGAATFIVLLFLWIIAWFADSVGPTAAAVLNYLSITEHFDDFGKGIIDTKHIVFYASFIVFCLFLTLKSVDSERWRG